MKKTILTDPNLRVEISEYKLQVQVGRRGEKVSIASNDFTKKSLPSINDFSEFPFLRCDFFNYVKELNSEDTAYSYLYYLQQLFNTLSFETEDITSEARKWFMLLPYFYSTEEDLDLRFQVLDYWMNRLNAHINNLKKDPNESSKAKTFANRKSALQAYINFLEDLRTNDYDTFSKKTPKSKVQRKIINEFRQNYTGITINVEDLKKSYLSRMRTEDRFPKGDGSVYYPARVLSSVLGKVFTKKAKECIKGITVYIKNEGVVQGINLEKIDSFTIEKDGITKAKYEGNSYVVYNKCKKDNIECESPLKAKTEADLSREHNPSIATILSDENIKWNALNDVTEIIKDIIKNDPSITASSISKKVIEDLKQKPNYKEIINGLRDDFINILDKTTFSLMQRSLNSSLNMHS